MSGVVGCEHYTLAYQVRQHHSHQDKYTTCACPPFLSPSLSLSLSLSVLLTVSGFQVEHFPGVVVLTSRMEASYLDLSRLPYLRSEWPCNNDCVSSG